MQMYRSSAPPDARNHQIGKAVLLITLLTTSSGLFIASTNHGIGILPDSVAYMQIGSAQHFAPLYTWLLQAGTSFGAAITTAAWWLGWGLLIVNTLLIFQLLQLARLSLPWAAICAALIVSHPVFVELHSLAMTEPLYFALVLSSVLAFSVAAEHGSRTGFAVAGAIVGLAMLTRFAAAPVLPALIVTRLLMGTGSRSTRIADGVLLVLATVVVFGSWLVASELTSGESTGRALEFLGQPDLSFWITSLNSVTVMLLPAPLGYPVRLAFLVLAGGATISLVASYGVWLLRQPKTKRSTSTLAVPAALGLVSVLYAIFLVASVLIQYRLNLTGRFLLPLYVFLVLATATAVGARSVGFVPPRRLIVTLAVLAVCVLVSNLVRTSLWTVSTSRSGQGYASEDWAVSPVLMAVSKLAPDRAVYSNAPDLIAFRLQREAEYLPRRFNHLTGREDADRPFAEQLEILRRSLQEDRAYVVFVDGIDWRDYLVTEEELLHAMSLRKVAALPDGRIYTSSHN